MISQIKVGGHDRNFSYLVGDPDSNSVSIVDPANLLFLREKIQQKNLAPKMILLTHSHFDHTEAAVEMAKLYNIPVYIHKNARGRVAGLDPFAHFITDGDELRMGKTKIRVMHTPGHCDDAVCFYVKPYLLTGDTVFVGKCGRTDLEGGSVEDLYNSIQIIKNLPDNTIIYPGHDYGLIPNTTVEFEKAQNELFRCGSLEEFIQLKSSKS